MAEIAQAQMNISEMHSRVYEIEELRHKSASASSSNKHGRSTGSSSVETVLATLAVQLASVTSLLPSIQSRINQISSSSDLNVASSSSLAPLSSSTSLLIRRFAALEEDWREVTDSVEKVKEELREDGWLDRFRIAVSQADQMIDSLEKAVSQTNDLIKQVRQLRFPPPSDQPNAHHPVDLWKDPPEQAPLLTISMFEQTLKSYEAKKKYYWPSVEKVLSILDKSIRERVTSNGEALRRHTDTQARWKSLTDRMNHVEREIDSARLFLIAKESSTMDNSTLTTSPSYGQPHLLTPSGSSSSETYDPSPRHDSSHQSDKYTSDTHHSPASDGSYQTPSVRTTKGPRKSMASSLSSPGSPFQRMLGKMSGFSTRGSTPSDGQSSRTYTPSKTTGGRASTGSIGISTQSSKSPQMDQSSLSFPLTTWMGRPSQPNSSDSLAGKPRWNGSMRVDDSPRAPPSEIGSGSPAPSRGLTKRLSSLTLGASQSPSPANIQRPPSRGSSVGIGSSTSGSSHAHYSGETRYLDTLSQSSSCTSGRPDLSPPSSVGTSSVGGFSGASARCVSPSCLSPPPSIFPRSSSRASLRPETPSRIPRPASRAEMSAVSSPSRIPRLASRGNLQETLHPNSTPSYDHTRHTPSSSSSPRYLSPTSGGYQSCYSLSDMASEELLSPSSLLPPRPSSSFGNEESRSAPPTGSYSRSQTPNHIIKQTAQAALGCSLNSPSRTTARQSSLGSRRSFSNLTRASPAGSEKHSPTAGFDPAVRSPSTLFQHQQAINMDSPTRQGLSLSSSSSLSPSALTSRTTISKSPSRLSLRPASRSEIDQPGRQNEPTWPYLPHKFNALDQEIARVVNNFRLDLHFNYEHSKQGQGQNRCRIGVERIDLLPKGEAARGLSEGQYAFKVICSAGGAVTGSGGGRKVLACKVLEMHRNLKLQGPKPGGPEGETSGSGGGGEDGKVRKVMVRVGGGWIDLEIYLQRLRA
ncbi:Karyogamy protein, KAR9 [Phaffia rhodozyma]|uniref:Karyogamy protein, KAR9 n=1 Tax=Phaffia rhodozyma TaxID=264483 RepID=A0A0F7STB9_PHARH|nr:Karyogamy protein, KAR9 [Phaffia rhodozyma]